MLEGTERKDDTPLHKAIREALTNLVIHADYMTTGVLRVEKHNDRFVFSNPGSLKLPIADIYRGGTSKARNPHIQAMLRMIGFGENIGSGFPTIVEACRKENWRKPILSERPELQLIELTISMTSLIADECVRKLQKTLGHTVYNGLSKEEVFILSVALTEEAVSNNLIQILLDKNPLEAGRLLYSLKEQGILISSHKGRWTSCTLNHDYTRDEKSRSKSQGATHEKSRSKSQGAAHKQSRSSKRQEIEKQLKTFCRTPRTLQEIAEKLSYSDKYRMKRTYIDPLLGTILRMTSAESKTDPAQKYVVIKK